MTEDRGQRIAAFHFFRPIDLGSGFSFLLLRCCLAKELCLHVMHDMKQYSIKGVAGFLRLKDGLVEGATAAGDRLRMM